MEHIRKSPHMFIADALQPLIDLGSPEGRGRSRRLMDAKYEIEDALIALSRRHYLFDPTGAIDLDTLVDALEALGPIFAEKPGTLGPVRIVPVPVNAPFGGEMGETFLQALHRVRPDLAEREQQPVFRMIRDAIGVVRGSLRQPSHFHEALPLAMAVAATDTVVATLTLGLGLMLTSDDEADNRLADALLDLCMHFGLGIPAFASKPDDQGKVCWYLLTNELLATQIRELLE